MRSPDMPVGMAVWASWVRTRTSSYMTGLFKGKNFSFRFS